MPSFIYSPKRQSLFICRGDCPAPASHLAGRDNICYFGGRPRLALRSRSAHRMMPHYWRLYLKLPRLHASTHSNCGCDATPTYQRCLLRGVRSGCFDAGVQCGVVCLFLRLRCWHPSVPAPQYAFVRTPHYALSPHRAGLFLLCRCYFRLLASWRLRACSAWRTGPSCIRCNTSKPCRACTGHGMFYEAQAAAKISLATTASYFNACFLPPLFCHTTPPHISLLTQQPSKRKPRTLFTQRRRAGTGATAQNREASAYCL